MSWLAETFWLWFAILLVVVLVFMAMTDNRVSRGQRGAGPLNPTPKPVSGLAETSWDLEAIERHLTVQPETVSVMLRNLADSIDVPHGSHPGMADNTAEVERLVAILEQHVEGGGPTQEGIGGTNSLRGGDAQ